MATSITAEIVRNKIVAIAEHCYKNKPNNERYFYTDATTGMDKYKMYGTLVVGAEWCTSFADWCYIKAMESLFPSLSQTQHVQLVRILTYQPTSSSGASSTAAFAYFKSNNSGKGPGRSSDGWIYFSKDYSPSVKYAQDNAKLLVGAKVFIGWPNKLCHTGIIHSVTSDGYIQTIEGNAGDTSSGTVVLRKGTSGFKPSNSWGRVVGIGLNNWDGFFSKLAEWGITSVNDGTEDAPVDIPIDEEPEPPPPPDPVGATHIKGVVYYPMIYHDGELRHVMPHVFTDGEFKPIQIIPKE